MGGEAQLRDGFLRERGHGEEQDEKAGMPAGPHTMRERPT